jgi:hypothetical protein
MFFMLRAIKLWENNLFGRGKEKKKGGKPSR